MRDESQSPGRKRLLRLPSPGIVIAMIALLVATGGTAYGVGAARHYPEFNGVDIIDNTLDGRDIKNGSLGSGELSSRARKALKGNLGPRGAQGPAGPQGLQGVAGQNGVMNLIYRARGPLVNSAGAVEYGYALCDSGYYALGGGAFTDNGNQLLNASYPGNAAGDPSSAGWVTWVVNTDTVAHNVTAYVICAPAASVGKTKSSDPVRKNGGSARAMKAR